MSILIQLIQLILLLQQLKPFKSNKTKSVTHEHTDQTCYETRNVTSGLTWGLDYLYRLFFFLAFYTQRWEVLHQYSY